MEPLTSGEVRTILMEDDALGNRKQQISHNDVEMIPDKGFTKQLKTLNKDFEVVWNWLYHRWEIWEMRTELQPYCVMAIQNKDRSYRELGQDILLHLQQNIHFQNSFTANEIVNYLAELDNQVRRRKMRDFQNKIQSIALDTRQYIHNQVVQVPANYLARRSVEASRA